MVATVVVTVMTMVATTEESVVAATEKPVMSSVVVIRSPRVVVRPSVRVVGPHRVATIIRPIVTSGRNYYIQSPMVTSVGKSVGAARIKWAS